MMNSGHRRSNSAPSPSTYSVWDYPWEENRVVSPSSSFGSQDGLPTSNEADAIDAANATIKISLLNGVSSHLLSEILVDQQNQKLEQQHQIQSPVTSRQSILSPAHDCKPKRKHRPSLSLSSLDIVPEVDGAWHSASATTKMQTGTGIQPNIVTLPSQPTKTYQVFDDLSVTMSEEQSLKLPPLDEYFEEKKESDGRDIDKNAPGSLTNDNRGAALDADLVTCQEKGEKVAVAMHDPSVVRFLVDYCED
jgi:hypothetical protein